MKKLTAILLALVLMFSLSATTLAEDPTVAVGSSGPINGNSGATVVTVAVNTSNLSVTVPVSMTIVAPVAGGVCTAPDNYAIVNKSAIPVKVSKIAVTDPAGGLTFSDTEPTLDAGDNDKVSIALTPAGEGAEGVQLLSTAGGVTTGLGGFDMEAATDDNGVSKAITITAKSGMLTSTEATDNAFTITFTVEAGTTT